MIKFKYLNVILVSACWYIHVLFLNIPTSYLIPQTAISMSPTKCVPSIIELISGLTLGKQF